jgi:hypothetical protein
LRPRPNRPVDIYLTLTDNGGYQTTMEIDARLGPKGVHLDREIKSAVEETRP